MKDNQRAFFNEHAAGWDAEVSADKKRHFGTVVEKFGIRPGDDILDIGTGTGVILPMMRNRTGPEGNITAIDLAENMLDRAREKFGDDFSYIRTAAEDMVFADDSFDAVVCFQVFPHFYDKGKALKNIFRVLKPGGTLVIAHGSARDVINNLHREVGGVVGEDRIPVAAVMTRLLESVSFSGIRINDEKDHYLASAFK